MIRHVVSGMLLLAATLPAHAGGNEFKTPSKNIDCYLVSDATTLVCTRYKPNVQTVFLSDNEVPDVGPPETDSTEAPKEYPVLGYGKVWRHGSFSCNSEKSGLTCKSRHHGFTMSRSGVKVY